MQFQNRHRFSKRILSFSLLVIICLSLIAPHTSADDISRLRDQYAALQKQEQQLQKQIYDQNSQLTTAQQKKASIDSAVKITREQITILNAQISAADAQIEAKNEDISSTQQALDADKSLFEHRLCAMYKAGNVSYIEVLLSSKSITDYLSRSDMLRLISQHDTDIIGSVRQQKAKLVSEQTALQAERTDLVSSQGSMAAKQDMLNAQLAQQSQIVSQIQNNISAATQQSQQVAQKARQTDAEINAAIAAQAAARAKILSQSGGATISAPYLVKFAEGYTGVPYVYGSADPQYGFDCSGFVQYVFANAAGIALTHSALAQSQCGTPVSKSDLQPGDLVFFDTSGGSSINHVGIYVGGDQFIEANSSTSAHEVIITDLFSSSYWSKYYRCARRILN